MNPANATRSTLDGRPDLTGIWIAPPFAAITAKFDQQGSGEIVIQGRDGSVENFENDNALRRKDFQEYGVMFPSRITHKIDGAPVAEFTVSDALANPYLIFPPPKELNP